MACEATGYSLCNVWLSRDEANYPLDLVRERLDFPDLTYPVIALHRGWGPWATLVETKGSGTSLLERGQDGALRGYG